MTSPARHESDGGALAEFEAQRARLLGLGYRMLGTVAEAEDLVQETYLRWHRRAPEAIDDAGAWLATTMARLCIDALRARKVRRDAYVGPWLPEPWRTHGPDDDAPRQLEIADDLSVAFLLLLERLGPDERAAFLLHDVFDTDYAQIAASLDKSEVAVRQLVSRARQRVAEDRRRFRASRSDQADLAARFQRALVTRDERALLALFKPDATLITDGGGKALAALRPIYGAVKIVRFFVGVSKDRDADQFTFEQAYYNDAPTIVVRENGVAGVFATFSFDVDDGRIAAIYSMRNPDKLERIARADDDG